MIQHLEVVEKIEQELIYTFEKYEKMKESEAVDVVVAVNIYQLRSFLL
jgi:hypothetical protein